MYITLSPVFTCKACFVCVFSNVVVFLLNTSCFVSSSITGVLSTAGFPLSDTGAPFIVVINLRNAKSK